MDKWGKWFYKTDEDKTKDNEFITFVVNGMKNGNDIDQFIFEQFKQNKSFRDKFSDTYYKYKYDKDYQVEIHDRIKSKLNNNPTREPDYGRNFMHTQSTPDYNYGYGGTRRKRRSKKAKKTRRQRKKRR
jgi:hypothetical protein